MCRVFRAVAATTLILASLASLTACDSSKPKPNSGLAAALALAPQNATLVLFTDWAAFGHKDHAQTRAFAGSLANYDLLLGDALGFRSTDAAWEADVTSASGAPVTILQFDDKTDLGAVEAKFVAQGYHKSSSDGHDMLVRPAQLSADPNKTWEISLGAVAIDSKRHLMVAAGAPDAVNPILGNGPSLGERADVKALGRVGPLVSAAVSVGKSACQPLAQLSGGRMPPATLQQLRQRFTALGTLSPFTADIVGVPAAAGTTGLAALTFADAGAARANAKARAAAPPVMSAMIGAQPDAIKVTSASASGPVLKLALQTSRPPVLPEAVANRSLGFDVCL